MLGNGYEVLGFRYPLTPNPDPLTPIPYPLVMAEQHDRILGYFLEEASEHLNTIEQGLGKLAETVRQPTAIRELFRAAHSIKGSAAMLGLTDVQQVGNQFEANFKLLKDCPQIAVNYHLQSLFLESFSFLRAAIADVKASADPYRRDPATPDPVGDPVFEELRSYLQQAIARIEQSGDTTQPIRELPPEVAVEQIFGAYVTRKLGEISDLCLQLDRPEIRTQIQKICHKLGSLGENFEFLEWSNLFAACRLAIVNPDRPLSQLAASISIAIKQAQALVLSGRHSAIEIPSDLAALIEPQQRAAQMPEPQHSDDIFKVDNPHDPFAQIAATADPHLDSSTLQIIQSPPQVFTTVTSTIYPANLHTGPQPVIASSDLDTELTADGTWMNEGDFVDGTIAMDDLNGLDLNRVMQQSISTSALGIGEYDEETFYNPDSGAFNTFDLPNFLSDTELAISPQSVATNLNFADLQIEPFHPDAPAIDLSIAAPEFGLDSQISDLFPTQIPADDLELESLPHNGNLELESASNRVTEPDSVPHSNHDESRSTATVDRINGWTSSLLSLEELGTAAKEPVVDAPEDAITSELSSWIDSCIAAPIPALELHLNDLAAELPTEADIAPVHTNPALIDDANIPSLILLNGTAIVSAVDDDFELAELDFGFLDGAEQELAPASDSHLDWLESVSFDREAIELPATGTDAATHQPELEFNTVTDLPATAAKSTDFNLDELDFAADALETTEANLDALAFDLGDEETVFNELGAVDLGFLDNLAGGDASAIDFEDSDIFANAGDLVPATPVVTESAVIANHDLLAEFEATPATELADLDFSNLNLANLDSLLPASNLDDFVALDFHLGAIDSIVSAGEISELASLLAANPTTAASVDLSGLDDLLGADAGAFAYLDDLIGAPTPTRSIGLDDLDREISIPATPVATSAIDNTADRKTPDRRAKQRTFEQTMRVSVRHLDNLNNLVGELVVNRNTLEQDQNRMRQFVEKLLSEVQKLNDVGKRMQDLYERSLMENSLVASRQQQKPISQPNPANLQDLEQTGTLMEYDPLEMDRFTPIHMLSQKMIELTVRVRESTADIEFVVDGSTEVTRTLRQITGQLQEDLTKSRMIPFAQTADRLQRGVRDNGLKYGKQVELSVEGRDTSIDKVILESLTDPLIHMVNNAIAHGIESPATRQAAGKPIEGKIMIRALHQGNQTIISIADDGAGIDTERVKAKAIEKGIITAAQAAAMSKIDAYELLFLPSFSTKDVADELAGRGVGLDVVRNSLTEIRGTITTESQLGIGTTFTIRLPLALSIAKAIIAANNKTNIAFPLDGIEDTQDVSPEQIQTNQAGEQCIFWRDELMPFKPLSDLLGFNRPLPRNNFYSSQEDDSDLISILILRSDGILTAVQVDKVVGDREIAIKPLQGPANKPLGIAGATVLGDGRIVPIADVMELVALAKGTLVRQVSTQWSDQIVMPTVERRESMVLIVDDSITVRELLSLTFKRAGYRVEQARDGQEAWDKLRAGLPCDIVFCDIEMPRMDGLEFLSRVQKDLALKKLPVAMLTSRGSDRHRQIAAQLGASGYFIKPYLEEALLDAAKRMIEGEVLAIV